MRLTPIKPALDRSFKETVAEVLVQLRSSPSIEGNQLKEILDNPLFQVNGVFLFVGPNNCVLCTLAVVVYVDLCGLCFGRLGMVVH